MAVEDGAWIMKGVEWDHPEKSWQRIFDHVKEMYEEAEDREIERLIGKKVNR